MNKIKRITAAAFSYLLVMSTISGCSKINNSVNDKPTVKQGGYVELKYETEGNVQLTSEFSEFNNKLSFYDLVSFDKYKFDKEEGIFKTDNGIVSSVLSRMENIISICSGPSGECFISYFDMNKGALAYACVDPDGKVHPVKTDVYIVSAEYTNDGKLYASALGLVGEISSTNYSFKSLLNTGIETIAFDIVGDYLISADEEGVHIYDYKNNKEIESPDVLNSFFIDRKNSEYTGEMEIDMCSGENSSIYIAANDGIFRYVMNGNQIEQLIDAKTSSIGDPSKRINSLSYNEDSSFFLSFNDGSIVKYYFDSEKQFKTEKILRIYSLRKNDTLLQLINSFSAQNTNIQIDYQVGMKNGVTYGDAMKALTTQILTGEAPDVIMLDGMDIDNFIDKNMLYDLNSTEEKWNPNKSLVDNIAKWNVKSGVLYSVACKFRIPAIAADEAVIDSITSYSDIADYVEKIRKTENISNAIISFDDSESVINNALIYSGNDIINESGVDKIKLKTMYDNCLKIYENDQPDDSAYEISFNSQIVEDEYKFATRLMNVIGNESTIAVGTLNAFEGDLNLATSVENYSKPTDTKVRFGLTDDSKMFLPTCNLGIVESCKNINEALEFIKSALSSEQQKIDHSDGFPVNSDSLKWYYDKNKESDAEDVVSIFHGMSESDDTLRIEWMSPEEVAFFDNYIHNLSSPVMIDEMTKEIIIDSGKKCLEGKISSENAAEEVIRQLDLKMKE